MQKATGFNNIAIVYIKGSAYRIHFSYMSNDDAINIMTGSNLVDKRGVLYIKMNERNSIEYIDLTYYQRDGDVILNRAKHYYENNKERLRVQVRDKYRNLSEEEKYKKREYRKNR